MLLHRVKCKKLSQMNNFENGILLTTKVHTMKTQCIPLFFSNNKITGCIYSSHDGQGWRKLGSAFHTDMGSRVLRQAS